jgi:hypothetical protein
MGSRGEQPGEICATASRPTTIPPAHGRAVKRFRKPRPYTANAYSTRRSPVVTARHLHADTTGHSLWGVAEPTPFVPSACRPRTERHNGKICRRIDCVLGGGVPDSTRARLESATAWANQRRHGVRRSRDRQADPNILGAVGVGIERGEFARRHRVTPPRDGCALIVRAPPLCANYVAVNGTEGGRDEADGAATDARCERKKYYNLALGHCTEASAGFVEVGSILDVGPGGGRRFRLFACCLGGRDSGTQSVFAASGRKWRDGMPAGATKRPMARGGSERFAFPLPGRLRLGAELDQSTDCFLDRRTRRRRHSRSKDAVHGVGCLQWWVIRPWGTRRGARPVGSATSGVIGEIGHASDCWDGERLSVRRRPAWASAPDGGRGRAGAISAVRVRTTT